jgi:DNA-3-methyladenine glycosylase I
MISRCAWAQTDNRLMTDYHDREWGLPVHDDTRLFEMLILEGAQAGLSWNTILKKRDEYRIAFCNFDPAKVAAFGDDRVAGLLANPGIVRNRLKIQSAIRNAKAFLAIQTEFGSFDAFLWAHVSGVPEDRNYASLNEIPVKDELSDRLSSELGKRGMNFVGSTILFAFMQAVGMINAHTTDCFRHEECRMGAMQ